MARTSYLNIPPELAEDYWKSLQSGDRFVFAIIKQKVTLISKKRKAGLAARSYLPTIAEAWNGLSVEEKTAWSEAGAENNLNGYRLFVQDKSKRIINDLPGNATPSLLHQSLVGQLHIGEPASELKIVQLHPRSYWISKKVTGKKGMYEPVKVTEDLTLPFKISLNYRAELEAVEGGNFAQLYARFWHSYQGQNIFSDIIIPLELNTTSEPPDGWKHLEASIALFGIDLFGDASFGTESEILGYYVGYNLYFHLKGVRGDLYIDNIKAEHSGQNWARDPWCKDIHQDFTKAFYQVPKHWAAVILPDGAWFESIYKDF